MAAWGCTGTSPCSNSSSGATSPSPHGISGRLSPESLWVFINSSAPSHPHPTPAASRSIQHRPCLTRGCKGRGLRAPCAALLFCSSHVSPSSGGIPAAPSGLLHKIPNKKDVLIPSFPEVFRELCCARDRAGCGVCCPVTLGTGPVWLSP